MTVGNIRSTKVTPRGVQEVYDLITALSGKEGKSALKVLDDIKAAIAHNEQVTKDAQKAVKEATQAAQEAAQKEEASKRRIAAAERDLAQRAREAAEIEKDLGRKAEVEAANTQRRLKGIELGTEELRKEKLEHQLQVEKDIAATEKRRRDNQKRATELTKLEKAIEEREARVLAEEAELQSLAEALDRREKEIDARFEKLRKAIAA